MAIGETVIENFAASEDCASTLGCLEDLGVSIIREGSTVTIKGVGKTGFQQPKNPLGCGNSGTTMRLLSGILAGQNFESVLTGDESLQKRPMKRVIDPLTTMGAAVDSSDSRAPLKIVGRNPLNAVEYELPVASAQIKSCVLLAGLNADGETSVIERVATRDHTEKMLRWFGAEVREQEIENGRRISIWNGEMLFARDLRVPGDISSAAFFMVAAACLEGSELILENVGFNPTRSAVIDVLQKFGADIEISQANNADGEPVGTVTVRGGLNPAGEPSSNIIEGEIIANLIDEIPVLAVFGTHLEHGLEIRGASELRVKESDRISAITQNLKKMGARIEEFPDGFRVERSALKDASVDSFGDHRIAMAFAIAGLLAEGETEIHGSECAAVSFPDFFDVLKSVASE